MIVRAWDIQWAWNPWLSLGLHFDHTDPSLTLHLPGIILSAGRCKQPGFEHGLVNEEYAARRLRQNKEKNDG